MTQASEILKEYADFNSQLEAADFHAVDRDQNWANEQTTFEFSDGSELLADGWAGKCEEVDR